MARKSLKRKQAKQRKQVADIVMRIREAEEKQKEGSTEKKVEP